MAVGDREVKHIHAGKVPDVLNNNDSYASFPETPTSLIPENPLLRIYPKKHVHK